MIGSMAEQISILHMEVNFQFDGIPLSVHFALPLPFAPPKKGMHPPNRRCTPLSRFLSKQYLFHKSTVILIEIAVLFSLKRLPLEGKLSRSD